MKDFFKNVFATVVGIALFFAIIGFFGFISIIGMLASGDSAVKVKDNSVLVLNLKGALQERAEDDIMAQVMGEVNGSSIGLDDILEAISKAKDNDNVKGIYIESGVFGSDSPASNHAIREALLDFKKSGKWIVAYGDQYIQSAYYICSAADQVWINPLGEIDWHGLGSTPYYLKDVMAKGCHGQVRREGTAHEGGNLQECPRNLHQRPHERRQPRAGDGIYHRYLGSDAHRRVCLTQDQQGTAERLC